VGKGKIVKVTGIKEQGRTATVLLRGSNKLVLEEAERSLHDALCVVRCLVHKRFLIPGGAAPEVELNVQLSRWAKSLVVRSPPPPPTLSTQFKALFRMGTWGFFLREAKQRSYTLARNKKIHRAGPFQSAFFGWSVPTKKCGYFEVNLSLFRGTAGGGGVASGETPGFQLDLRTSFKRMLSSGRSPTVE